MCASIISLVNAILIRQFFRGKTYRCRKGGVFFCIIVQDHVLDHGLFEKNADLVVRKGLHLINIEHQSNTVPFNSVLMHRKTVFSSSKFTDQIESAKYAQHTVYFLGIRVCFLRYCYIFLDPEPAAAKSVEYSWTARESLNVFFASPPAGCFESLMCSEILIEKRENALRLESPEMLTSGGLRAYTPTNPSSILEIPNFEIDKFYVAQERRGTDFEAPNLWKFWSGCSYFFTWNCDFVVEDVTCKIC